MAQTEYQKKRAAAARRKAARENKPDKAAFESKTVVIHEFSRPDNFDTQDHREFAEHEAGMILMRLWVDDKGSLLGHAGCDDCFVAAKREIPALIAFLQSTIEE